MKTKKIKIAVVEENHFYNHIIQKQISDLFTAKGTESIKFEITSIPKASELETDGKCAYQVILFDNHFKNNRQQPDYNAPQIIEDIKSRNSNCFFISISGYREMTISAYLYKEGELIFSYSKQSAVKNESHEEKCSIPALNKLMEKYIDLQSQALNQTEHKIAA